jgi:hypothetical protein
MAATAVFQCGSCHGSDNSVSVWELPWQRRVQPNAAVNPCLPMRDAMIG